MKMGAVVVHERWKCIACGACAAVAPEFWEMSIDDGKSDLIKSRHEETSEGKKETLEIEEKDVEVNEEAKSTCPVECISVIKKK